MFATDEYGLHLHGPLVDYQVNLVTECRLNRQTNLRPLAVRLCHAHDDFRNLALLVSKIEWLHRHSRGAGLDRQLASMYLALDIELFHVQLRSALDHCAACIGATSHKAGQVPAESLNALRNWAAKNRKRAEALLDTELLELVYAANWFPDVRKVRDSLVHDGASVLVFPDDERLLFQAFTSSWKTLIVHEHIMHNENVADFRLYAAILFSEFLLFLEGVTSGLARKYPMQQPGGARSYCAGFRDALEWLRRYAAATDLARAAAPSF